ncbi:peptide/nickel transport system permease protein [Nonomuraea thailandensis]|uniref:Peptide/nickel transport system permease protein n=1 Tax=Nonomuraea thailandensis TaxID=1188745 RepID=A0A9X2K4F1_9ACTN|nr:ABC transporter permease [Nonomuraea thailandensis]MCP2359993.1 peptide/nickel transport system permease protein [Nonomuraea thailandensis]
MTILRFLARRLGAMLLLLLVLSFLVFGLLAASPGSPLQTLIGSKPPTPELLAALQAKYHLDEPFLLQYGYWLADALHLDLGRSISIQTDRDVLALIGDRIAITLQLGLYAMVLVLGFGIPLGMAAGIRRGRRTDRAVSFVSTFCISAPPFVLSIALLYVFGVALGWFPVYGVGEGLGERIVHLTMPAVALAGFLSAVVIRQTRAATLTVMQQDFVTFARIRGLSPARVLIRYALRNSALPVVTSAGLLLIASLSAALFVEQVFSLPGIGTLLLQAVIDKDIPVVQGLAVLLGAMVVLVNLVVDLLGLALDPRTRTTSKAGA